MKSALPSAADSPCPDAGSLYRIDQQAAEAAALQEVQGMDGRTPWWAHVVLQLAWVLLWVKKHLSCSLCGSRIGTKLTVLRGKKKLNKKLKRFFHSHIRDNPNSWIFQKNKTTCHKWHADVFSSLFSCLTGQMFGGSWFYRTNVSWFCTLEKLHVLKAAAQYSWSTSPPTCTSSDWE